jgi:hypothetical protein
MNYFWTSCPKCSCQVTIQFVEHPDRLVGSVRRWSTDRTVNDGRRLEVPRAELAVDGGFRAVCVCGAQIAVAASGIERATTERPAI